MATASQLLLKFKQDFPDAGTKFESYGAITRDQFLTEAVNNAAAAGVSIEYGGYVNNGPQTSINKYQYDLHAVSQLPNFNGH
jgi:hypothetical protein